ncbi:hypothetical protein [Rhodopirellula bahusiensis]|uniref:Uncharacterized protein n=1 Tax=Rhodopirellula bahusiensis TaxID=2014065 RepID=A0A2G1WE35_9BACT|nr:hypothetical protein [Rhodopirellula bahusiensis]PHQ37277.1 hypothetical protein CEE69_00300 [Rhodopirellula bahusiensis]
MTNPYQIPTEEANETPTRTPVWYWVLAALLLLVAVVISGPGVILAMSDGLRPAPAGRQFATYDLELFLFGIPIAPSTARWLAFAVTPILIAIAVGLVWRGISVRRDHRVVASHDR